MKRNFPQPHLYVLAFMIMRRENIRVRQFLPESGFRFLAKNTQKPIRPQQLPTGNGDSGSKTASAWNRILGIGEFGLESGFTFVKLCRSGPVSGGGEENGYHGRYPRESERSKKRERPRPFPFPVPGGTGYFLAVVSALAGFSAAGGVAGFAAALAGFAALAVLALSTGAGAAVFAALVESGAT
ncbi:MAG: hypothetical protein JWO30_694 [Fibrobacteres bacterium]|nr:hypothetical protein [Fibrobacterota bacterium]